MNLIKSIRKKNLFLKFFHFKRMTNKFICSYSSYCSVLTDEKRVSKFFGKWDDLKYKSLTNINHPWTSYLTSFSLHSFTSKTVHLIKLPPLSTEYRVGLEKEEKIKEKKTTNWKWQQKMSVQFFILCHFEKPF